MVFGGYRNMKYYSIVGEPFRVENDKVIDIKYIPQFYLLSNYNKSGTVINGFTLPKNEYFNDKNELFEKYGLWENYSGWGLVGKLVRPINVMGNSFRTSLPILTGDIYKGQTVTSSVGVLDRRMKVFNSVVTLEPEPLIPKVQVYDNLFIEQLINTLKSIESSMDNLKNAFNLINVGTPVNGWATPPDSTLWNANINQLQQEINAQIVVLEDTKL